jgi:hypothetical protein
MRGTKIPNTSEAPTSLKNAGMHGASAACEYPTTHKCGGGGSIRYGIPGWLPEGTHTDAFGSSPESATRNHNLAPRGPSAAIWQNAA